MDFGANKRCFNSLTIDRERGLLTKTSEDNDKLANELKWFLTLPPDVQYLSPRIVDSSDGPQVSMTMELYGYRPLNDLWLNTLVPNPLWDNIFRSVDTALTDMSRHKDGWGSKDKRITAMYSMYVTKTLSRLDKVLKDPEFSIFLDDLNINGRPVIGLRRFVDMLTSMDSGHRLLTGPDREFNLIHGDLCLSNILYDETHGFIRLIDPRGSFHYYSNYGDPDYELAKLAHSFVGNYDFYINGSFIYQQDGNDIQMMATRNEGHLLLTYKFMDWLKTKTDNLERIQFIQSLLFLSMVPLHADRPLAQKAFICQGLQDFTSIAHLLC